MSYSRRQLYAMGEPLGDSATRREVGGKVIYGGGGSGGGGGGVQKSENVTYTSPVPEWLKDEQKQVVAQGLALAQQPYQPFTGERISPFTPLQQRAFGAAEQQQTAPQMGLATGLAGISGLSSFRDPGTAGSFMNPFLEQALAPQLAGVARESAIRGTQQQGEATMRGAFGGSRDAIMRAEREKNLLSEQSGILGRGYAQAFDTAQQQFNAERAAQLQAAGQLGQLGQQQFGQEMDIMGRQREFGDLQRQREQSILDQQFADFQAQRDFPYQQVGFASDIIQGRGGSTRSMFSAPAPNQFAQLAGAGLSAAALMRAEGGSIPKARHYAVGGGITGLLPDEQLQERMASPTVATIAKMAAEKEMMDRAQLRERMQAMQQGIPALPSQTVAEEMLAQMGIGGLEVSDDVMPDSAMAGGGIVAFDRGGMILLPAGTSFEELELTRLANPDQIVQIADAPAAPTMPQPGLPSALPTDTGAAEYAAPIQAAAPAAAPRRAPAGIASLSPAARMAEVQRLAGSSDGLRQRVQEMGDAEVAAREEYLRNLEADQAEGAQFWTDMRKKVESKVEGLSKQEYDAKTNQLLTIGAALLATDSPNFGTALGQALGTGVKLKRDDEERLRTAKEALDARMDELAALERGEKRGDKKEVRAARMGVNTAKTDLAKALYQTDKEAFDRKFSLAKDSVDAFAKEQSAERIAGTYAGGRAGAGAGGDSKLITAAEAAFQKDPEAAAIRKRLESPLGTVDRAKMNADLARLREIQREKYRQYGVTMETGAAPTSGASSDPLGLRS
jgi:hypothetical protein